MCGGKCNGFCHIVTNTEYISIFFFFSQMFWSDNNYYLIIFVLVDNLRMPSVVDMWMVCNRPCDYTWLSRGLVSPTVLFFFGWIGLFDGLVWTMGFSGPCWARALLIPK